MFGILKRKWAEARGNVLLKEVEDALLRMQRFSPPDQHFASAAFAEPLRHLESEMGPVRSWAAVSRKDASNEIEKAAQAMLRSGNELHAASSYGGALLARYLEAIDLPGAQAAEAIRRIEVWAELASA